MNGGLKSALLISGVALAGCSTVTQQVKIRPVDPMAPLKAGGDQLALARAQLALGNVGLALEAFHGAQRANPNDPAPAAGIGDCYAAMGRFDIAESSYEVALSLAPRDHRLLLGLASIYERAGEYGRASDIRAEALRFEQTAQMASLQKAAPVPAPVQTASAGSITVDLPPARPATELQNTALRVPLPNVVVDNRLSASGATATAADAPSPAPPAPAPAREMTVAVQAAGPRLERLSSGEIALVTTTQPVWTPPARDPSPVVAALRPPLDTSAALERPTRMASAERWVPLNGAPPKGVQVLNAAGRQGLAASARKVLSSRGWRAVAIGNARAFRRSSVVLYPKSRAALGRSLAAQFGVKARMIETDRVVLLLGRDVVASIVSPRRA